MDDTIQNDDEAADSSPQPYIDWLGQKLDAERAAAAQLKAIQKIEFGFVICATSEDMLTANAAERSIDLDDEMASQQITVDYSRLERNTLGLFAAAGLSYRDDGHDGNGDRVGSCWIVNEAALEKLKRIFDGPDEWPSTTSGSFNGFFPGSDTALWAGISEVGRQLLDVTVEFFDTDKLKEVIDGGNIEESANEGIPPEDDIDVKAQLNQIYDLRDISIEMQNYGLAISKARKFGTWVICDGFSYWRVQDSAAGEVDVDDTFIRAQMEKFMATLGIQNFKLNIVYRKNPWHVSFELMLPQYHLNQELLWDVPPAARDMAVADAAPVDKSAEEDELDDPETFLRHYEPRMLGRLVIEFKAVAPSFPSMAILDTNFYRESVNGVALFRYRNLREMRETLRQMKQYNHQRSMKNGIPMTTYRYAVPSPTRDAVVRSFLEALPVGAERMAALEKTNAPIWFYMSSAELNTYVQSVYHVKLAESIDPDAPEQNLDKYTDAIDRDNQIAAKRRALELDMACRNARADFISRANGRPEMSVRRADELAGDVAQEWAAKYGYEEGSDAEGAVYTDVYRISSEMFSGQWEDAEEPEPAPDEPLAEGVEPSDEDEADAVDPKDFIQSMPTFDPSALVAEVNKRYDDASCQKLNPLNTLSEWALGFYPPSGYTKAELDDLREAFEINSIALVKQHCPGAQDIFFATNMGVYPYVVYFRVPKSTYVLKESAEEPSVDELDDPAVVLKQYAADQMKDAFEKMGFKENTHNRVKVQGDEAAARWVKQYPAPDGQKHALNFFIFGDGTLRFYHWHGLSDTWFLKSLECVGRSPMAITLIVQDVDAAMERSAADSLSPEQEQKAIINVIDHHARRDVDYIKNSVKFNWQQAVSKNTRERATARDAGPP